MAAGRVGPAPLDHPGGVTTQLGFIPGCAVPAAVQTYSFLRRGKSYTMPVVASNVGAAKQEIT